MKNKNGFTLIEIIGSVIILGIISIIAVLTFGSLLKGFREDYYEEQKKKQEYTPQENGHKKYM